MATDDKKEYKTLLTIIVSVASTPAKRNKLGKLAIGSDDPLLRRLAADYNDALRQAGGPDDTPSWVERLSKQPTCTIGHSNFIAVFLAVTNECHKAIASVQPQWQRIALAHGWTPPAPKTSP